jgi:diguanylate cyclase (GGDEF)-like protein
MMQSSNLPEPKSYKENNNQAYPTYKNADLGLFNQLLQMIDGDWSDSINGICDHIQTRFNALGVSLNVFDKNYNEFIYFAYSTDRHSESILASNGITIRSEMALDVIKSVYEINKNILEYSEFSGNKILELTRVFSNVDEERVRKVLTELNLKTISIVPLLDANNSFRCSFHIFTSRSITENDRALIEEYTDQLNVALEIIFLVRELYIRATHDSLTKLFNHKQGIILLNRELIRIQRNGSPLSIAMLDLDHFKKINDRYGHHAGDEVLKHVSTLLTEGMRKVDIISRYGGEEFLLVFPDTDLNKSVEVLKRLKESIQSHVFNDSGNTYSITASFGVAQYHAEQHTDAACLIEEADKYLYQAKDEGRNRICYEH